MRKQFFRYQSKIISAVLVLGYGLTGKSVVKFLENYNTCVTIYDEQAHAEGRNIVHDIESISGVDLIITSPGFNLKQSKFKHLTELTIPIVSDIEIFAAYTKAPIIAVTGSNGKSTTVTLMGEVLRNAGYRVAVIGNIGVPVLSALSDEIDYYVIEISSFQLDYTFNLNAAVGCILNLSIDHIDVHGSFSAYRQAKEKLISQSAFMVLNRKDNYQDKLILDRLYVWLGQATSVLDWQDDFQLKGSHNLENLQAVYLMAKHLDISEDILYQTFTQFQGLPHRCQWIAEINQITYINDSKGTNIGATEAAIIGFSGKNSIILLLGGLTKGADFSELVPVVKKHIKHVIIFGQDRKLIEHAFAMGGISSITHESLDDAVICAYGVAEPGDLVLFSPACASFDQYSGYVARGEAFVQAVENIKYNLNWFL